MDSSEKTEIQIKFANWDKWLGAAWNLYSTKGWLLNFTNLDGEINGLCIRRAAGYTHFLTNIRRHFISAIESLCVIFRCLLKWVISRKLGLSPYQQFLSFIYESYMIVSFTIFLYSSNHCSFEISLTKVLLFSKGLESYLLHSGVHSLQLSSCLCSISLC